MALSVFALVGIFLMLIAGYAGVKKMLAPRQSSTSAKTQAAIPARDAFQAFLATRYFSGLDALRALSVIAVIWVHVSGEHALNLLNQGHKGVDFFFAISGFLVTTLLLREYARNGRIALGDFYVRRTLRIFPLYYAVLALYCVLVFLTMKGTPKAAEFWNNLPAFASYTSNWFVHLNSGEGQSNTFYIAWSLATEEQFYLCWPPLMILLLWRFKRQWVLVLAATVLLGLQAVAAARDDGQLLNTMISSMAPAMLFGVAFAVLLNNRLSFNILYPVFGNRLMAPALVLILLTLIQHDAPLVLTRLAMAMLVAAVCIRENTCLHPILKWRPAVFIGSISYGIYLMHMLMANVVRKLLGHQMGLDVFLATTALTICVAYFSFRFFEAPILKLKNRTHTPQADGIVVKALRKLRPSLGFFRKI